MLKILITGSDGFVGARLSAYLEAQGHNILRVTRSGTSRGAIAIGDIAEYQGWPSLLQGVDCVIHCAARAHVLNEESADPLTAYRNTNVVATERLVKAAIEQKVRRFIFLSSIGVLGTNSNGRVPFSELDECLPSEAYSISKLEAEKLIKELCCQTALEYVIVRPPLVYGPGSKGNFLALIGYVKRRLPFPIFAPRNRRSLIALDNLINFISLCSDESKSKDAANQTFLISDEEVVSTVELLRLLSETYGKDLRVPSVPYCLMKLLAQVGGKSSRLERMFDSLEVNSEKARSMLGWKPVISMRQQLDLIAKHDSNI